ncbi:hypothetical protein H6G27_34540 [Nostoc linckia FACHB-104]|nr:hypothetical protein [Nostoc linckia FACHB-104]
MAREPSKGPVIQKRVKRLLAALLGFVAGEFAEDDFKIEYDWKEADSPNPKLTIKTTLVSLEALTCAVSRNPTPNPSPQARRGKREVEKAKREIREALNLLKDFVKILEDNRIQTQGSDEWHFTLKLWSRDKEKNLKRFDEVWQSNKSQKSQEIEANYSEDEGVVVPQTKLAIFQAPPLPAHFVERPEYSDDLKTRLLTEDNRTLVITAIHGLGSVGKSTLAAALAVDAEIQTRFCDGILWATLGQQPDVLSLISGWVQALGDYSFKPTSVEATTNQLRTLLYDKAVLLVVDDAWNTQDAQAFNVGGVRCQVLVTTREGAIADALAASTYSLDIMKPSQAMALLTKKLRREITGAERHSAENLAKGVGYLPLALELAATEVASGTTWDELLADIRQEVARLTSFDRPGAEEITDEASLKRLSLTASLNLSIKRMPQEKQQYFAWLGVLPEDVNINKMMAATLWAMGERNAAKILQYLRNKALLLTGVPFADGTPSYRLHDLFHDLACNLLTAAPQPKRTGDLPGLGLNLADAHTAFLENYRQKTPNNLWHTLPNDGYIHQRLVWHLEKARRVEEIHSLLREESATGNNGWFEVREKLGQTGGYITDISRAWELAEANWDESTLPQVVSLQCRYALITASLNSLAANLPIELLVALVKNNLWTAEQGLAYALQNPDLSKKVEALAQLVHYLLPNLKKLALKEALKAAKAIQDERYRAYALSALAETLPPHLLPEALKAAKTIQSEEYRAYALSALAETLPPHLLPEALIAARAIQDERYRAYALSALAETLPPQLLLEVLTAARAIKDKRYRVHALIALTDKLPEVLPEALAVARAIQDEDYRAHALIALTNKLPEVLPEALAVTRVIQDEDYRIHCLITLIYKLPTELLPEALAVARAIQDENYRVSALSALAEKLPEVLPEELAAARAIRDEEHRTYTLISIAAKLPELLPETLAAARSIPDERSHIDALIALTNQLPEVFPEALAAARSIPDEEYRILALSALAEKRPEVLPEALAAARSILDEQNCTSVLRALVKKLPPQFLPDALAATTSILDEYGSAHTLNALAAKLPEVLSESLAAVRSIQDKWHRALALRALAAKLPLEIIPEALAAARLLQDQEYCFDALRALSAKLPTPELFPDELATAELFQNEEYRSDALNALPEKLSEVLPESLAAARSIQHEWHRALALSSLADKLPSELLPEALAVARLIQDEHNRAKALSALALSLSKMPLPQLFLLWQDTLHKLSFRTRSNLLGDIEAFFSVILVLGGEAAMGEVYRAIIDVGRWWK